MAYNNEEELLDVVYDYNGHVLPYQFEPEFSEEEVRQLLAERARRRERDERVVAEIPQAEPRTGGEWWCTCTSCLAMQTESECFCCREWDMLGILMEDIESAGDETDQDQDICVTKHPDFAAHTNAAVLETFFRIPKINWKRQRAPAGHDGKLSADQYRLVAYRLLLEWFLRGERLGRGERRPLPSCVVLAIRKKFPSPTGTYVGFKEFEDAEELL